MPNKKLLDPSKRVFGICGSATEGVIGKVKGEAERRGIKVAVLVGEILGDWASQVERGVYKDDRQMELELLGKGDSPEKGGGKG